MSERSGRGPAFVVCRVAGPSIAPFYARGFCFALLEKAPASAVIEDASGLEPDYDLLPPSNFPSAASAAGVEALWTKLIDPDSR